MKLTLKAATLAGAILTISVGFGPTTVPHAKAVVLTQVQSQGEGEPKSLPMPATGKVAVAFVIGKDAEVLDFCGPLEVFASAYTKEGVQAFNCYTVAESTEPVRVGGPLKVIPDYSFENAPPPKVIVIPAMDMSAATPAMLQWVRNASKQTDVTMSVCNGAFVLAKTGLLAGMPATCHHGGYFRFAGLFPDVKLKRGARFTEAGNLACAGGVSSGIDLSLRVIQRYLGSEAAIQLADGIEYQGQGWTKPDGNEAFAKIPDLRGGTNICPLCQMESDRNLKSEYRGKTYTFCSQDEKDFFDNHLQVVDRFLAEESSK